MDAERRTQWVAALRSGKYSQGMGLLRNNADKMCCLGVAINEFCAHQWRNEEGTWINAGEHVPDEPACMPTDETRALLGLTQAECRNLAELNDDGLSFNEIANHIERSEHLDAEFNDARDKERGGGSNRT